MLVYRHLTYIMFAFLILVTVVESSVAGYAGSSPNDVNNNGFGYGYSGSFAGNGANFQPPVQAAEFQNFLSSYFDSFSKYHQQFLKTRRPFAFAFSSSSSSSPSNKVSAQASSSITFDRDQRLQQQVEQAASGSFPTFPGQPGSGLGQDGAIASASLGQQGGYQTAAVFPENPNIPNIISRFSEGAQPGNGGGGYGVFTSSSSSNLDGKSFRTATTTINDNGKVTTYTVKNP